MTRDQAKKILPFIEAFANGKRVLFKYNEAHDWEDSENFDFYMPIKNYKIKEEKKENISNKYYKLKTAIEKHRAQTGHNMCWENDIELWSVLEDGVKIDHTPPPWCEFMQKCAEYRKSKDK